MAGIKERVAYLHGLTKGLNVDEHTPEGKVLLNIIDVLNDMAEDVEDIYLQQQDLETYVETLDEDLNDLEDEIYDTNCCCEEDFVEMNCPVCHEDVSFEADILDAKEDIEVTCPHCGSVVYDTVIDCDYTDLHSIEHDEYDEHHYCGSHHHPGL